MWTITSVGGAISSYKQAHVILELIEKYPISLSQPDHDGRYPLHLACARNDTKEAFFYDDVL
jgi:hypothetical protein